MRDPETTSASSDPTGCGFDTGFGCINPLGCTCGRYASIADAPAGDVSAEDAPSQDTGGDAPPE